MATIGRAAAVAEIKHFPRMKGFGMMTWEHGSHRHPHGEAIRKPVGVHGQPRDEVRQHGARATR